MNFGRSRQTALNVKKLTLFFKVLGQLFRNRAALEQEYETEQQRKKFQEKPDHAAAWFVLAAGKIFCAELE